VHDRSELVGTWRLRSWDSVFDDGSVGNIMGEAPAGVIVYTADGTVIVTISASHRSPIEGNDPLRGPDDQRLAAMATFIAYSGAYHLDGSDVIHDVSISLYPNWVGGSQRRHAALSDDGRTLTLSTDPIVAGGRPSVQRLVWGRVPG
jgi:Lipocalin-like domain